MNWALDVERQRLQTKVDSLRGQLAKAQQELADVDVRLHEPSTWTLNELAISTRTLNCLTICAGLDYFKTTLGDLAQWSAADLLKIRRFGYGSLAEVEKLLGGAGLRLRGSRNAPTAATG